MSQSTCWSDERVATLSRLWQDGLSASQIARQLGGVTRNAVIGKIHRLGISTRAGPSRPCRAAPVIVARPKPPRPAPAPTGAPIVGTTPTEAVTLQGPGLVRDLAQLGRHACKWPIGDPKARDFSFCGLPAAAGPWNPSVYIYVDQAEHIWNELPSVSDYTRRIAARIATADWRLVGYDVEAD